MKILLFPYAKPLRNGNKNPKNYPWWKEFSSLLIKENHTLIQVGVDNEEQLVGDFRKNLSINDLSQLMKDSDTWISVDSFGQHLGWHLNIRGMVIFGQSDPIIFGHNENVNVLKSRNYLRKNQFWLWEQAEYNEDAFNTPSELLNIFKNNFINNKG